MKALEIEIMKKMLKDLRRYRTDITDEQAASYRKLCDSITAADGLYCPACYIDDDKKIRVVCLEEIAGISVLKCYTCKVSYQVRTVPIAQ